LFRRHARRIEQANRATGGSATARLEGVSHP
jgi:hypothetical protein